MGFYLALLGTLAIGIGCSFGEIVFLGFLRGFPPDYVSGYGAGTGLAGIYGTAYYLLMKETGFPGYTYFLLLIPTQIFYYFAFTYLNKLRKRNLAAVEGKNPLNPDTETNQDVADRIRMNQDMIDEDDKEDENLVKDNL